MCFNFNLFNLCLSSNSNSNNYQDTDNNNNNQNNNNNNNNISNKNKNTNLNKSISSSCDNLTINNSNNKSKISIILKKSTQHNNLLLEDLLIVDNQRSSFSSSPGNYIPINRYFLDSDSVSERALLKENELKKIGFLSSLKRQQNSGKAKEFLLLNKEEEEEEEGEGELDNLKQVNSELLANNNLLSSSPSTSTLTSSSRSSLINLSLIQTKMDDIEMRDSHHHQQYPINHTSKNFNMNNIPNPVKFGKMPSNTLSSDATSSSLFSDPNMNSSNNNNDKFVFASPSVPKSNRPALGMGGFLIKSQKSNQPDLKIDDLQIKKQAFYFGTDQLFAKPNELLREDKELSSILNEELNNSRMDEDDISNSTQNYSLNQRDHTDRRHHSSRQHRAKGGKITIAPDQVYEFKESDLKDLGQIGNGEFGTVHKVLHKPSNTYMALKRIGPTVGNQGERKKFLKSLILYQNVTILLMWLNFMELNLITNR